MHVDRRACASWTETVQRVDTMSQASTKSKASAGRTERERVNEGRAWRVVTRRAKKNIVRIKGVHCEFDQKSKQPGSTSLVDGGFWDNKGTSNEVLSGS
ncbi:uncharacterized protein [Venturia canescens]|uniref:uncharacterized protein n=1 Tax=Venturia canescens TaxID=32260 RepID=UPI001C9C7D5A|nr:uncharacterized protein LOC122411684 [Venturia canescens]